jgi:hypothetical protein
VGAIDNVLERLERVRRVGGGWMARCPAHEDRSPSLKVAVGEDGKVLLNCKVGCSTDNVLEELGLEWKDLFNSGLPPRQPFVPKPAQRDSESSSRILTREEIEEEWDAGRLTVAEYMRELDAWNLSSASPTKSRVSVEFDDCGEIKPDYDLVTGAGVLWPRKLSAEKLAEVLRVLEETKP